MATSKRRKNKISDLSDAIARGDFASARRVLAPHGGSPAEGQAPDRSRPNRETIALDQLDWLKLVSPDSPPGGGRFYLARRTLEELLPDELAAQRQYAAVMRGARQRLDELEASAPLCCAADARAEDLLFVSAMTCGVSDPVFFLVGMMFYESGRLVFEQAFAADERQEEGICSAFARRYSAAGVLVTFGQRRSPLKALRDRCGKHEVDLTAEAWDAPAVRTRAGGPVHLDLRKECRARWRRRRGGCSLAALERTMLGRRRQAAVARTAIREAYRQFLATGDAGQIGDILKHNALDMLTMAQLLSLLLTGCEQTEPCDF